MNVLIIEDDKFAAELIANMVRSFTEKPIIAYTMEDASRYISEQKEPPEIITVDLAMPDSDRTKTIRIAIAEIRQRAPESLIIVLTGMTMHGEPEECIASGADAVFEKHDVATPKMFMDKLTQLVIEMNNRPSTIQRRVKVLEAVAKCIKNLSTCGTSRKSFIGDNQS